MTTFNEVDGKRISASDRSMILKRGGQIRGPGAKLPVVEDWTANTASTYFKIY